jgi:hypothetical protein
MSRTPDEFVRRSIDAPLSSGELAATTRAWTKARGLDVSAVKNARKNNPRWRETKLSLQRHRSMRRFVDHNYSNSRYVRTRWDAEKIQEFLSMNILGENGRYVYRDWQMAKRLKTSIPSIQYWRRKVNMAYKILGDGVLQANLLEYLSVCEQSLRKKMRTPRQDEEASA